MDKYDTLEYSRVKATTVSMRLRIYLCAFKIYQHSAKSEGGLGIINLKTWNSTLLLKFLDKF